jgi:hypothetical protein
MSNHVADISRFTTPVNERAVKAIVDYCGIALRNRDSALVSTSDPAEVATVATGFAVKKLALTPEAADAGIKAAAEKMRAERNKSRVTCYYLIAEAS